MKHRLFDGGSILLVVAIVFGAFAMTGFGNSAERCAGYKLTYDNWVKAGKPGDDPTGEGAYRVGKFVCAIKGINI